MCEVEGAEFVNPEESIPAAKMNSLYLHTFHLQQQVPKKLGAHLGALPPFSALVNGFIKHTEHLYKLKACSIHMIKLKNVILFF
jgi:hypothetical protein